MAGFEAFNVQLYKQAASTLSSLHPSLTLTVFTDRDIATQPEVVDAALAEADVFFGSLIFDYDQVSKEIEEFLPLPPSRPPALPP
jgi:magnesium chelatase subunit H